MKTNTERTLENIADELKLIRKNIRYFNPETDGIRYSKLANADVSKLMSDMIIKRAGKEEIERVTEYSMAVMEARKKYGIDILEEKYLEEDK